MNKKKLAILAFVSFIITFIIFLYPSLKEINIDEINNVLSNYNCSIEKIDDNNYQSIGDNCNFEIKIFKSTSEYNRNAKYVEYFKEVKNNENVKGRSEADYLSIYSERTTNGMYYKTAKIYKDTVFYLSTEKRYRDEAINFQKEISIDYEPRWIALVLLIIPFILLYKIRESN